MLTKPSAIWRSMLYYSGLSYVGAATFGRSAGYRRCDKCHNICGALVSQNGPALEEMMAGAMGFRHLQYNRHAHVNVHVSTHVRTHVSTHVNTRVNAHANKL